MSRKRVFDAVASNGYEDGQQPKKSKRTYTDRDATLAKVYESLASDDDATRHAATLDLMQQLTEPSHELLERTQSRLILGLCSNRKSARLGFFVALAEFWRLKLSSVGAKGALGGSSVHNILTITKRLTTPDGGASNQEKRDYAFGRLTAIKALIHSGCIFESDSVDDDAGMALNEVFDIANGSAWLREQSGMVLCEAVRLFNGHTAHDRFLTLILSSMVEHRMAKTPEGIALWLLASNYLPKASLPNRVWHHASPLSRKELSTLSSIMRHEHGSPDESQSSKSSNGTRQRMPHFSWDIIIAAVFKDHGDSKTHKKFETLWSEALDNSYFSSGASPERKSIGFQILIKALVLVPPSAIHVLFSKNIMGCLMNQSSKPDRLLHSTARSVLQTCVSRARTDVAAAKAVLRALITGNGIPAFDRLTNSKTVQNIITTVDDTTATDMVRIFQSQFEAASQKDTGANEQMQRTIADVLLQMCRGRSVTACMSLSDSPDPPAWLYEITWLFARVGLLVPESTSYSAAIQEFMKSKLSSALAAIMSSDPGLVSALEFAILKNIEADKLRSLQNAAPDVKKIVQRSFLTVHRLHGELKANATQTSLLLFASSLIEALGGSNDALSLLDELTETFGEASAQSNEQRTSTVLDIILGLVSRQSSFHSRLGERIFQGLANNLSEADLDAMIDVLGQKETLAGQEALFERAQDEQGEDSESENNNADGLSVNDVDEDKESDSEDDDVEVVSEGESVSNESSTSGNGGGMDTDEDDELARFDDKLASVLKMSGITSSRHTDGDDEPGTHDDDDTSSESSMDDEQMMALDSHIIAVFRDRAAASGSMIGTSSAMKKREKTSAKQNVGAFKNRVLDLLGHYFKIQHANPLALRLIIPLLHLVRTTNSKQIADKASNLLQKYFDFAKHKGMPHVSTDLGGICELVHAEALSFASKVHAASCSRASLFIARVMLSSATEHAGEGSSTSPASAIPKENQRPKEVATSTISRTSEQTTNWLIDLYAKTHKDCLRTKSGLPASFWADWVSFSLSIRRG